MSDEQNVATEAADSPTTPPAKPVESPPSGSFRASGLAMALILGVVIGVLACVLVSALVQKPQINTAEAPIVIKETVASDQASTGQALAGLLEDTGAVADQVVDLVQEKNFGKAAKKLDELAAMLDRAKQIATTEKQQTLVNDLTAGVDAVRKAVGNLAAANSLKRARALRQKITAAVKTARSQE